jgi:nucleoid DNA-binding protein
VSTVDLTDNLGNIGRMDIAKRIIQQNPGSAVGETKRLVDEVFDAMRHFLSQGKTLEIRGFATITPHREDGRKRYIPISGEVRKCSVCWRLKIKTSHTLRTMMLENLEDSVIKTDKA